MGKLLIAASIVLAAIPTLAAVANEAIEPDARTDTSWIKRHEAINQAARELNPRLVFVGDSITHFWEVSGKNVWAEEYSRYSAANLGILGDRTQHVLWRLENGNLDGIAPELAVVLIGTNNVVDDRDGNLKSNTPEETAEGVVAVVRSVRQRAPATRVLLLGVFPRTDAGPDTVAAVRVVNGILAATTWDDHTWFKDIGDVLLEPDGTLSKAVMWDLLHLTEEGYRRWAEAIRDDIRGVLDE